MTENNQLPEYNHSPMEAPHYPFSLEGHWQPWYDDRRDYNTNAPTYYDYLSNFNKLISDIVDLLNRVARRNIVVEDTNCVDLTKINDWIDEGNSCHTWHDDITLKAEVILSTYKKAITFDGNEYELNNLISCLETGLYAPDYMPLLQALSTKLNEEINNRIEGDNNLNNTLNNLKKEFNNYVNSSKEEITNLKNQVTNLSNALQKIVTNLYNGGNASSNDINSYNIINQIACGNINLYGGSTDGSSLIRTHKDQAENDVTIGSKG